MPDSATSIHRHDRPANAPGMANQEQHAGGGAFGTALARGNTIVSSTILQPWPAALTNGLEQLERTVGDCVGEALVEEDGT